ncbi:MAG: LemA family protein [Trueperaceae bacterium]|nr:LemA family protein [Trueperaceae bacterium]
MGVTLIIVVILIAIALFAVTTFNRIIGLENRVANAWSQIDVQLKKRNDLIPNLVETVKGYATHEKGVFEEVARSRQAMMNAQGIAESAQAANMLEGALGRLFAIAENYPQLRASENFQVLQEELSSVENKIAYARQFYNDAVLQYNNAIETIPGVLFAGPMNKKSQVHLEIPETERTAPKVSFS